MKIKKTFLMVLPLSLGLVSIVGCNNGHGFSEKTIKLYNGSLSHYTDLKLYFSDSYKGIPFIELNDSVDFLKTIYSEDINYGLTAKKEGQSFIFNRENGSSLTFDFSNNIVESPNLNKFKAASYCKTSLDSRGYDDSFYDASGKKIENQVRLNTVTDTRQAIETKAQPTYMALNNYNIKLYKQSDKYFVPFTTFYNIAGNPAYTILFNGENLFAVGQTLDQFGLEYKNAFYSFPKQDRSKELKEYNYYEFCRDLDFNYGLCSEHGITTSFDTYLSDNGLKSLLLSDNKLDEYKAYLELQYHYFADSHSGFTIPNPYYGTLTPEEQFKLIGEVTIDPAYMQKQYKSAQVAANRKTYKNIGDTGVLSPITQTDNTLIITFDKFLYNSTSTQGIDWYYNTFSAMTPEQKKAYIDGDGKGDTLALISYANDIIQNDTLHTIKNVVLDLSGNTGGAADTAIFTLGWLDSAQMQLIDPISDYRGSITYASDINFDKKIDKNDLLVSSIPSSQTDFQANGGKVYCLTSDTSFSCGNYVPAMLKQSGLAKLVGSKSGGGACIVHVTGTADASGISFSGNKKLCIVRNGSYYSIDEGIEPDYPLNDAETLYGGDEGSTVTISNRKNLVTYLNSLK